MPYHISRDQLDRLVEEALRKVPKRYLRYLNNVTIVVKEFPSSEDAGLTGVQRNELLGLFAGAAYPAMGRFFDIPAPLPDSITLYQQNIEAICNSEDQLIEEIRLTMVHEVRHYFGMSEETLKQY